MKVKHYFAFDKGVSEKFDDDTLNENNWDILRTDESERAFALEKDVESYEKNCIAALKYKNAAEKVCSILDSEKISCKKVISLGVGKGILEWHLKKMKPKLVIECTDYTANAIEQLKKVFIDIDSAYQFDILNGNYPELDIKAVFLMYRVSTEFSQQEWIQIFSKMYNAGIEYIIFIPTGLDNLIDMMKEKLIYILNSLRGRKNINCGWLYSESEYLKNVYRGGYNAKDKIYFDKTAVYLLKSRV